MARVPASVRPYWELARLHRFPIGTMVMFWPGAWTVTMGAKSTGMSLQSLATLLVVHFIANVVLHGAACTINDICDIDFDRQVERTKSRPLASGRVSIPAAWMFLLAQVALCLWLLSFADQTSFWLGVIGLFPLHAFYPLMKRVTYWPQAWLGLAMNWGIIVGWSIVTKANDWLFLSVFLLGGVCWTIVYDTIYALQDKADDIKAGVKSTALLFGSSVKPILSGFSAIFVGTIIYAGLSNGQGMMYYIISVGGPAVHLVWQLTTLDVDSPADCSRKFLANGDLGFILWLGTAADYLLPMSR